MSSIPAFNDTQSISKYLHVSKERAADIIKFLKRVDLCYERNGKITMNVKRTIVSKSSPMLSRHHLNWRLKGLDAIQLSSPESVHYTSPMSLSFEDAKQIKEIILTAISKIEPLVEPSPPEQTYCLNIDWFKF